MEGRKSIYNFGNGKGTKVRGKRQGIERERKSR